MKFLIFLSLSLAAHSLLFLRLSPKHEAKKNIQAALNLEPFKEVSKKNLNEKQNKKPTKLDKKQAGLKSPKLKTSYFEELKGFIQSKATYPKSALSLKQEGTVLISLSLNMDGLVTDFKVLEPSKFNALTSAAIKLVKNTRQYKPLPKKFYPGRTFTLPIHYILK